MTVEGTSGPARCKVREQTGFMTGASPSPEFTCDDNVHPNADGCRAMGEFVDLALFSPGPK
jgi:hypothetical protein